MLSCTEKTRKLSYSKDELVMCPKYGCPKNFPESLSMSMATFPKIFNGLLFRLRLRICVQNLKFVALPVAKIIGGTQKLGQSLDMPMLPFYQNF